MALMVGYWVGDNQPWPQPISTIPFELYTHMIAGFLRPVAPNQIESVTYGIGDAVSEEFCERSISLGCVPLVSLISKATDASAWATCTNSSNVATFVTQIVSWAQARGYQGVDVDWEVSVIDSQYRDFVIELRNQWPSAIISCAQYVSQRTTLTTQASRDAVNFISIMCYDLHTTNFNGTDTDVSWGNGPIRMTNTFSSNNNKSAEQSIEYFVRNPPSHEPAKLLVGMPFYGYRIYGTRSDNAQPFTSAGQPKSGAYTSITQMSINEIYGFLNSNPTIPITSLKAGDVEIRLADSYISFNDLNSCRISTQLAKSIGSGGVMVFAVNHEYGLDGLLSKAVNFSVRDQFGAITKFVNGAYTGLG